MDPLSVPPTDEGGTLQDCLLLRQERKRGLSYNACISTSIYSFLYIPVCMVSMCLYKARLVYNTNNKQC